MPGRADRTVFGRWFWTVDRPLFILFLILISLGLIAVAAASPAASQRLSGANFKLPELFFLKRQFMWVAIGLPVLIGVSLLPKDLVRRLAVLGTGLGLLLLASLPVIGAEINGAIRWIQFGGFQLQPSEFLKPAFVVTTAWILSLRFDDEQLPVFSLAGSLLAVTAGLLVIQPDYGQTLLIGAVWAGQALLAGLSLAWVAALGVAAIAVLGAGYVFSPHISGRIDRFLTGEGDTYQADRALDALRSGGLFGTGPGGGEAKYSLPEPHTDYIFAVIGEEFGILACIAVAGIFLAMVIRVLSQLIEEEDPFVTLAASGLAAQIALQAFVNMGVATSLLPSKGMTLPFISHGGSSFIALCLTAGMLLALTRRNRFLKASPFGAKLQAAE
ncbi:MULTISPECIES: FtsW/RodA/SpoVE family cell cycle protein [Pacificimonas]|nr:putative peptidoglycan glycosyltransferase FtsW [Pacificimonas aurantium]